jgi:hypothetical protein
MNALSLSHLTYCDRTTTVRSFHSLDHPPFPCTSNLSPQPIAVKQERFKDVAITPASSAYPTTDEESSSGQRVKILLALHHIQRPPEQLAQPRRCQQVALCAVAHNAPFAHQDHAIDLR